MNRRDFDTLVRAVKRLPTDYGSAGFNIRYMAAKVLADEIKTDNANFDEDKFLERCGVKP